MANGFVGCGFFFLLWLFVFRVFPGLACGGAGAKVAGRPVGRVGDALVCMSCWLRHARCSGYGWFGVWDGGGGP